MDREKLIEERNLAFEAVFELVCILLYYWAIEDDVSSSAEVSRALAVLEKDLFTRFRQKDEAAREVLSDEEITESFEKCEDSGIEGFIYNLAKKIE